jgi:hypothetical protein
MNMEIIYLDTDVIVKITEENGCIYKIGLGSENIRLSIDILKDLALQKYNELRNIELNPPAPDYKELRRKAYDTELGDWREQLDMIYHNMDEWKERVKQIKDRYTKPEVI